MSEEYAIVRLEHPLFRGSLSLKRLPKYLRFCCSGIASCSRNWDALDQVEDTAQASESCVAGIFKESGSLHLDRVVNGRRVGEWHKTATYAVCDPQPSQEIMHDNEKWKEWCMTQEAEKKAV